MLVLNPTEVAALPKISMIRLNACIKKDVLFGPLVMA